MKSIIAAAGLAAFAQAFTQPVQPPSYGSLLTPDLNNPVTTGQDYTITWSPLQPSTGVTVSLVLCNGPSSNCVLQNTAIVEGVAAGLGSYTWSVPCSLPAGVQSTATGYGMLIIVDGTGQFQYSTQFSVNTGASCGSSTTSSTVSSSSSTTSSSTTTSSSSSSTSITSSSSSSSSSSVSTTSSSSANGTSSVNTDGWAPWATASSSSSTLSTSTVAVSTTPLAVTTSKPAVTTPAYTTPSATSASSSATTTLKPFTGAAAVPTAFVNAAGLFGAAALAALAL